MVALAGHGSKRSPEFRGIPRDRNNAIGNNLHTVRILAAGNLHRALAHGAVVTSVDPRLGAERGSSEWRHLMREDLAAVNVTRTYTLAASNIAIFTFMLFFLYPRFESGSLISLL